MFRLDRWRYQGHRPANLCRALYTPACEKSLVGFQP